LALGLLPKPLVVDKRFLLTMPNKLDELISQAEAARIRGVTPQAIGHLIKAGKLKAVTVAGRRLVFRSEVENFKPDVGGRPIKKDKEKARKRTAKRPTNSKRLQTSRND